MANGSNVEEPKRKVLFVCLGNSCRSPIAESVFRHLANFNKWEVDSAALADWNVGLPPNPRAIAILKQHKLNSKHIARQVSEQDFHVFDYIFGMDNSNVNALFRMAPDKCRAKILLLGEYGNDTKNLIIRDPYFDVDNKGFELCYQQCVVCCQNFLASVDNAGE